MDAPRWLVIQAIGKNCTLLVDSLGIVDVEEITTANHFAEAQRIADARNLEEAMDDEPFSAWQDEGTPATA